MAEPSASAASFSRGSRNDIEGVGKFKLAPAAPKGSSYKAKFQSLRERYDVVTLRRDQQRRELEQAQQRLKDIQAENDLMLDAMQIVTPLQPELLAILQSIEAECERARPKDYPGRHPEALPPSLANLKSTTTDHDSTHVNGHARSVGLNGRVYVREYESAPGDCDVPMIEDIITDLDYPPERETNGR